MSAISPSIQPRIYLRPGFDWDAQDAYLFDIDGTLLRTRDRIHVDAFTSSVHRITGFEVSLAGISLQGSTDTAIIREACRLGGVPSALVEDNLQAMLDAMCAGVRERRDQLRIDIMPGIEDALRHLARQGRLLGVATGNLEVIGWVKIEQAGLREWFRFGGFSDRYPVRSELIRAAAQKARDIAGSQASVCVVGDTPRDIEAARANSLHVIAVATGRSSFDELMALSPDACATSLADLLAHTGSAL
jgi:phosphoglycolate phosphatase-like HAD superfamily hydrolase